MGLTGFKCKCGPKMMFGDRQEPRQDEQAEKEMGLCLLMMGWMNYKSNLRMVSC